MTQISAALGASIGGLDLNEDLDGPVSEFLRDTLAASAVVKIEGQELSAERQVDVLGIFGPVTPAGDGRSFTYVSNREPDGSAPFGRLPFHSDFMWSSDPIEVTSLYAYHLELPVESTTFAGTASAFAALPDDVKDRVRGLSAENINDASSYRRGPADPDVLHVKRPQQVATVRPLVIRRPDDGPELLCASEMMTSKVLGLSDSESEDLLETLFAYLYAPENLCHIDWKPGDFVIWDNFAAQHGRANVTKVAGERTLRKVNVGGATVSRAGRTYS